MLETRKRLALACRILYMEELGDFNLGHMSCRVPGQDYFYMKPRGLGLEEVTPEDFIRIQNVPKTYGTTWSES
jgi:ribulose-5-phosphate 4-epimerase/fuculose-1-phosphate aldolase